MLVIPIILGTNILPQIVDAFAKCVGGLLSVIGENLTLKMETEKGTTISEVHSVHWNPDNRK